MSPTLVGVGGQEKSQTKVNTLTSVDPNRELKERDYMGFSECSSVGSSENSGLFSKSTNLRLNLKATELRLGLPGSQSPERSLFIDEKPFFPLFSPKSVASRSKRGFSVTVDAFSEGPHSEALNAPSPRPASIQEIPHATNDTKQNHSEAANDSNTTPAPKAQVVGWPPIRPSFRKNSMPIITSKNVYEIKPKALFVKVSMDGAPYLRKVDLRTYSVYQELSSALEKMFGCFTIGQYGALENEKMSETKMKEDLLNGSEYVLTYEDKDADWMLVGDVPWEMFISTCKRLRIMKSCDAIGLAPKAVERSCKGQKVVPF